MAKPLKFIITTAGINAIRNLTNDGTQSLKMCEIAFGDGTTALDETATQLTAEKKRLTTIAGKPVGDGMITVAAHDTSEDAYMVFEIGVYAQISDTQEKILFAVCSQQDKPIISKTTTTIAALSFDIAIASNAIEKITFENVSFANPPATKETAGIAKIAKAEEITQGANDTKIVTPKGLKQALLEHDTNINVNVNEAIDSAFSKFKTIENLKEVPSIPETINKLIANRLYSIQARPGVQEQ